MIERQIRPFEPPPVLHGNSCQCLGVVPVFFLLIMERMSSRASCVGQRIRCLLSSLSSGQSRTMSFHRRPIFLSFLLTCFLFGCLPLFPITSCAQAQEYTNEFAIHIKECGDEAKSAQTADQLAERYGFVNQGKVLLCVNSSSTLISKCNCWKLLL